MRGRLPALTWAQKTSARFAVNHNDWMVVVLHASTAAKVTRNEL
jgi:hypothetical protein